MEPILSVDNLTKNFGGLRAIDNLELKVFEHEIVALIGPTAPEKPPFSTA